MKYKDQDRGDRLAPERYHPRYWHFTRLAEKMRRIATSDALPAGEVLVDYGCGNMPYRSLFEPRYPRYVGADLPGNPLATLSIDEEGRLPVADAYADCVLSSQVLEHVGDPGRYLAEAYRVLRPGGALVLSTHGIWRYHPDPTDFWRWTADGLRQTVEQAGFQVVQMESVQTLGSVALQLWQDATAQKVPSFARKAYIGVIQRLMGVIDRRHGDAFSPDASVFVVLARRS